MADSILTPGYCDLDTKPTTELPVEEYLKIDNYLSEYDNEEKKSVVRENLNIYPKDNVYTKNEVDTEVSTKIRNAILEYLNSDDPHGILPLVTEMISNVVRNDGSTPFFSPQTGVDPRSDNHLATKRYVDLILQKHLNTDDPHDIISKVLALLVNYALNLDVYKKNEVYTKREVDNSQKEYVKRDGTTPFTKALSGIDPTIDSHIATKRYVDKTLYNHLVDIDPHGFITILNNRLASYAKKKDVYDKTQTYSRSLLDSIIRNTTLEAVNDRVLDFYDLITDKYEQIRKLNYVKLDGSIPFINPLPGVDAVEDQHLVTLRQVKLLQELLQNNIDNTSPIWVTSGPVLTTVGFVEDNSEVPETLTFLETMDAIFYGLSISISVPDYVTIGNKCPVTLCIHGSIGLVSLAELYLNGQLIFTFLKEDFEGGCITVESLPIYEDTEFIFRVYYTNNTQHETSATVECGYPVFVGLLPKWKEAHTVTMDYLKELVDHDTEGTLNRFIDCGSNVESITFKYKFLDPLLRHPFVVLPKSYPDLNSMVTESLSFGVEAFDFITDIPLSIDGVDKDVIFKIYIYKLALSSLNLEITFNFNKE